MGERVDRTHEVRGSNPLTSTRIPFSTSFKPTHPAPRCAINPLKYNDLHGYRGIILIFPDSTYIILFHILCGLYVDYMGEQGMNKLTATQVKSLSKPGRHRVDDGLYLRIQRGGSRQWVFRVVVSGKRRDVGLGPYPALSLAQARQKSTALRLAIMEGKDPLAEKEEEQKKSAIPTFRQATEEVFKLNQPRWKNAKHTISWRQTLEKDAMPIIGDLPVDEITREHVLKILTPIWTKKPETARRVRQRIRTILKWVQAHGFIEINPAGEMIEGALIPQPKVKAHFKALPYQDVPEALRIIEASQASMASKLAIRFLVLTAARSGEVRNAVWDETDLDARTWTIPADKMKAGAEHRVPLSAQAVEVLEQARELDDGSGLIFPSPLRAGEPLSDMSLTQVLRKTGLASRATIHGFRSSFRDWCAETDKPRELAESALAHIVRGVEGAYFRSDLFERRRRLMAQWASFLTEAKPAKVVQLIRA